MANGLSHSHMPSVRPKPQPRLSQREPRLERFTDRCAERARDIGYGMVGGDRVPRYFSVLCHPINMLRLCDFDPSRFTIHWKPHIK